MGDENLEAADDLGEWNGTIALPRLNGLAAINEDHKVVVLAVVMDLGLGSVSTSHPCSTIAGIGGVVVVEGNSGSDAK